MRQTLAKQSKKSHRQSRAWLRLWLEARGSGDGDGCCCGGGCCGGGCCGRGVKENIAGLTISIYGWCCYNI